MTLFICLCLLKVRLLKCRYKVKSISFMNFSPGLIVDFKPVITDYKIKNGKWRYRARVGPMPIDHPGFMLQQNLSPPM
jgi:hypothetical protein